jgi:hypothetical protein
MRKLFKWVMDRASALDTKDARRSVASDLKKASAAMFGLLMLSVPGAYASVFKAIAELLEVKGAAVTVSTWTLVALGFGAFTLRVFAFLLECDMKPAEKSEKPVKVTSRTLHRNQHKH